MLEVRETLVLALALVACADSDPHAIETCESGWTDSPGTMPTGNPVTYCEAACVDAPIANETDVEMSCIWSKPPNSPPLYCPASRFRDGGCCVPVPDGVDGERARIALINCYD